MFKTKRAITAAEHGRIIEAETAAAERNQGSRNSHGLYYDERCDFYELRWHTGAAQSDAAHLRVEDIDWRQRTICYSRKKLKGRAGIKPALIRFGAEVEAILRRRPQVGALFPYLRTVRPGDRATEFRQRVVGLGITGVSLARRALGVVFQQRGQAHVRGGDGEREAGAPSCFRRLLPCGNHNGVGFGGRTFGRYRRRGAGIKQRAGRYS